tara:strand:- start:1620 stop:1997 length:378 start_codon:yes stop_codon:yes gene_type:complete
VTYYYKQIIKIREENFLKPYLIERVIKAKQAIDTNYNKEIDLNFIAKEAIVSKYHLIRLFKNAYGRTPYQLITERRIQKAVELFKNDLPVSEVCYLLGFESISSFSIYFKKHIGVTPTNFKKSNF